MPAVEILGATFAAVSAIKDAIDLWSMSRNRESALKEIDEKTVAYVPQGERASREIIHTMSAPGIVGGIDILDIFTGRVDRCSDELKKILTGNHPDDIIDDAMVSYKNCVCRELNRVRSVSPTLPPEWGQMWDDYECGVRSMRRI